MADEVIARKLHHQPFREPELWYLLYHLLNAVRRFEPFCEKSGRISQNEVLLNIRGEVRLKCMLTSPFAEYPATDLLCKCGITKPLRSFKRCGRISVGLSTSIGTFTSRSASIPIFAKLFHSEYSYYRWQMAYPLRHFTCHRYR